MDDLLPSYETAVNQDPWPLIAPHLPSDSLCSAALVCRQWHQIMAPQLWGSPASHFGVQNDTVYVALTRFKRILPYVRQPVRELTHTLQFPPAHAEIYGGPHAEWLRDCFEYLPRLQSLLVNGLPFFDHSALVCLRHVSLRRASTHARVFPMFGLRLLDASGCTNATSTGLVEALSHLPNLVSLDFSRTPAARDAGVLAKLANLPSLRLLSLKGLALRDTEFEVVASSIETRVRSLDVTDNQLTDASARALLDHCLKDALVERRPAWGPLPPLEYEAVDSDLDTFESENVVGHTRKKLTEGFVGSLAIERARAIGITHLYLSKNAMTVEGISGLLRSKRMQVLDIGVLPTSMQQIHPSGLGDAAKVLQLPSVSKLTPIIANYAAGRLNYLRISHEIVTEDAPTDSTASSRLELDGSNLERYMPPNAHEVEAVPAPTPELDSTDTTLVELPGDLPYPVELQGHISTIESPARNGLGTRCTKDSRDATDPAPEIQVTAISSDVERGTPRSPQVFTVHSPHTPMGSSVDNHSSHVNRYTGAVSALLSPAPLLDETDVRVSRDLTQPNRSRHNSTHYVEDRRARLELRQSQENRLHPSMLPKMHTLVLTDVPTLTNREEVVCRLIQYVKDAAEEASIARKRAEHSYALPPGRRRAIAEREHAHGLFALNRIVLEMAAPRTTAQKITTGWRAYPTKSSTEDADSEAFWDAASKDFSFFGEEECGLPDDEPGRTLPLAAMSGLELVTDSSAAPRRPSSDAESRPLVDVIHEIATFRRQKQAAYDRLVQMGDVNPDVEGHWPGDMTVVRKSRDQGEGQEDFYGNRYESGWHYR